MRSEEWEGGDEDEEVGPNRAGRFETRKPEDSPASIPIIFEDKMSGVAIVDGDFGLFVEFPPRTLSFLRFPLSRSPEPQ